MAGAYLIVDENGQVLKDPVPQLFGEGTNVQAEMLAIKAGLNAAISY